jgi:hypothetical protein
MALPRLARKIPGEPQPERIIMDQDTIYGWERLPEYVALQQYGRCLGRILRSLPWRRRRRVAPTLTGAAILMAQGIAGFHAELPPDELVTPREREVFRTGALIGLRDSRAILEQLSTERKVSRPDLLVASELLERVEAGLRSTPSPPSWL